MALSAKEKHGLIEAMPHQALQMAEFEYADRLAELLAGLQNDIMQPLRFRLKEIANDGEKAKISSERELNRQTENISERVKEALQETDDRNKKLAEKRRVEEDSKNGLIRQYQKSSAGVRENLSRIQLALQKKGLHKLTQQFSANVAPPMDDSNLDNLIRDESQVFQEAQQILSGPLARVNPSRIQLQCALLFFVFCGFGTFIALVMYAFTDPTHTPESYIFCALVIGGGASLGLNVSMTKQKMSISDILAYPNAKRRIASTYAKLSEYVSAIENGTKKHVERLDFEKSSELGRLDRSFTENKELFEQFETRILSDRVAAEQQHQARLETMRIAARDAYKQLKQEYIPRVIEQHRAVDEFWKQTHQASAEWADPIWHSWQPDPSPEFAARLGKLVLEDTALIEALPELNLKFELPGLMPFASGRFLLFETNANARPQVETIQSLMLRALANVPPGKLRFTFIDPVGLGQSVAPFLALGDLDEQLISGRAWSESQHIDQQLGKLTEHMEMVIQKYLRNDYPSIRDYNHMANEVAEPFRFLVVFDFPTNFNDSAIRRLVSITRNGPRCGIFTLLVRNTAKPLPYNFNFDAELRPLAFTPYHQLTH